MKIGNITEKRLYSLVSYVPIFMFFDDKVSPSLH